MKRPALCVGFPFVLGLSLSACIASARWIAVGILAAAVIAVLCRRDLWKYILLSTLSILMACCIYSHADASFSRAMSHVGQTGFTGTIMRAQVYSGGWTRFDLDGTFPDGQKARVEWFTDAEDFGIGDTVTLYGNAERIAETELFNSEAFARSRGVSLHFGNDTEVTHHAPQTGVSLRRVLADWRGHMTQAIGRQMHRGSGAMLTGMLFGDRSSLSRSERTMLNRTGIGHVLVVSGLHLDFLAVAVEGILRKLRIGRKVEFGVMAAVCIAFVLLAGETVPVTRACIMILIRQSGRVAFRLPDALNSLSIAVFLICLRDPFAIFGGSFWMTVTATFGVAVLGPYMTREMPKDSLFRSLLADLACGCWAFAAMLPVQAAIFREVSLISPLSNAVLLPVCVSAMLCGVVGVLLGAENGIACFFLDGADVLNDWVLQISQIIGGFSFTHAASGSRMLLFALVAGAMAVVGAFLLTKRRNIAAFAAVGVLCVTFAACRTEDALHREELRVALFGEEANGLLAVASGEETVLVDLTGEKDLPAYAEAYLQEEGIRDVTALCLYHPNRRRIQRYEEYLAEYPPDVVRIPETAMHMVAFGRDAQRFGRSELLFHGANITFGTEEIYIAYGNQQFVFGQDHAGTGEGSLELTFSHDGKCRSRRIYGEN